MPDRTYLNIVILIILVFLFLVLGLLRFSAFFLRLAVFVSVAVGVGSICAAGVAGLVFRVQFQLVVLIVQNNLGSARWLFDIIAVTIDVRLLIAFVV